MEPRHHAPPLHLRNLISIEPKPRLPAHILRNRGLARFSPHHPPGSRPQIHPPDQTADNPLASGVPPLASEPGNALPKPFQIGPKTGPTLWPRL